MSMTGLSGLSGLSAIFGSALSAPPAPTGLTATPGVTSIALSWTVSTGATSYNVYRGTTLGGETLLASGVGTNAYTDSGQDSAIVLNPSTPYYYKVTAVNSAGESAKSSEVNGTAGIRNAPASWGLVSLLAEGSLTADLIGSNTLSVTGTPTLAAAKVGNGILISAGNYCQVASNSSLQGGSFDYFWAQWMNASSISGLFFGPMKGTGTIASAAYATYVNTGPFTAALTVNGGTLIQVPWGTSPSTNTPYFVFAWIDSVGGTLYLSVNGGAPVSVTLGGHTPDVEANVLTLCGAGAGAADSWQGTVNQFILGKPSSPLGNGGNGTLANTIFTALYQAGNGLAY